MDRLESDSPSDNERVPQPAAGLIERLCEQAGFFASNLALALPAVMAERQRLEEKPEQAQVQSKLEYLKEEQEAALMARVRLDIYSLELHRHPPTCPYCWMLRGRRVILKPMLEEAEAFSCEVCGSAY